MGAILGDPGADTGGEGKSKRAEKKLSGTNQKPERRRPFGTGLVRHCPQELFSPFFTFLRAIFSRPLRLFLAPTFCPWVSEDEWGKNQNSKKSLDQKLPPPPKKKTPMPNFPVGVKWYNTKFKNVRNWMKCLFLRNTMWIYHTRHYHESSNGFEYPKNPYLKQASPWKYFPNSPSQKYPGIENCKPKKILRSSPSLEIRSTPPPPGFLYVLKPCTSFTNEIIVHVRPPKMKLKIDK